MHISSILFTLIFMCIFVISRPSLRLNEFTFEHLSELIYNHLFVSMHVFVGLRTSYMSFSYCYANSGYNYLETVNAEYNSITIAVFETVMSDCFASLKYNY